MEVKQVYQYYKQQNGKYTISSVPIFAVFKDERGSMDEAGLQELVANMQQEAEGGWYARLIDGHHEDEGMENRPGLGYLDNFHIAENGWLHCDFVEVTEEAMQCFLQGKYPYRSAEWEPSTNMFSSCAVLESQNPYFHFPLTINFQELQNQQTQNFQAREALRFSRLYANKQKQNGGARMATRRKSATRAKRRLRQRIKKQAEELSALRFQQNTTAAVDPSKAETQNYNDGNQDAVLQQIMQLLQQLMGQGQAPAPEQAPDNLDSTAMQRRRAGSRPRTFARSNDLSQRIAFAKQKLNNLTSRSARVRGELQKFSKNRTTQTPVRKLTRGGGSSFSYASRGGDFAANYHSTQPDPYVRKFGASKDGRRLVEVARMAAKDYKDTLNESSEGEVREFRALYPTEESYVDMAVKFEGSKKGYYRQMIRKGAM